MKNLKFILVALVGVFFITACNSQKETASNKKVDLSTEVDSVSYALGFNVASQVKSQGFSELNYDAVAKALMDVYESGDLLISEMECGQVLQEFSQKAYQRQMEEMQAGSEDNLKEGQEFLAKNKTKPGIKVTESGIQYEVIKEGTGPKPKATDVVNVHYHGTLIDGTVFDSSVERGEPIEFGLNQVIPGWTEGVQLMPVGSKYKFYIPSELAYGANPRPGGPIGPNMALIFEIELFDIVK